MARDVGGTHRVGPEALARFRSEQLKRRIATLVVLLGPDTGLRIPIDTPELVIGRSSEADWVLHDHEISRRHLALESDPVRGRYRLRDLGSTNGTRVNLEAISEVDLKHGDKIFFGSSVLRFGFEDEIDSEHASELQRIVFTDDLTGLVVWRHFRQRLATQLQRASETGTSLALLMMDLDGLKGVNDRHGHAAGASVIAEAGRMIGAHVVGRGEACRFGGDEYVARLDGFDLDAGCAEADLLCAAIRAHPWRYEGHDLSISISIGVATHPESADNLDALCRAADEALYRAKAKGRDCVSR